MGTYAIVATRTETQHGAVPGPGLAVYDTNTWALVSELQTEGVSYLALRGDLVVGGHSGASKVSSYQLTDGQLTHLTTVDGGGDNPVYVEFSPDGRHVLTANYSSGSVSVLPVSDGVLGEPTQVLSLPGEPGQHKDDQDASHPHQITLSPDGRVYVADKGLDTIFRFDLNDEEGTLFDASSTRLRHMNGPRHLVFSGDSVFCANELSNSVVTLPGTGDMEPIQYLPTLAPEDVRESRAGGIVVTDEYVIVSNRTGAGDDTPPGPGTDTLAAFRIRDGLLEPVGVVDTGYLRPRFIGLDPSGGLIVAHDHSGVIQRFTLSDGLPTSPEVIAEIGSPMCVVFG